MNPAFKLSRRTRSWAHFDAATDGVRPSSAAASHRYGEPAVKSSLGRAFYVAAPGDGRTPTLSFRWSLTAVLGGAYCAFTLIEMILAVAIAAVVLIAINTVLFGAIHLRAKTIEATEQTLPMDRAVATLKQDLLCILQPGTNSSNSIIGPMGTDATGTGLTQTPLLEIYTASGNISDDAPWCSVQKIDYWLQPSTNRNGLLGQDLVRGITRNLLPTTQSPPEQQQVLLQNVQRLQFSFFDGTNWNDTWSTTLTNVPVAIKGAISFAKPKLGAMMSLPVQFLVPVVAWANSTNTSLTNITTGL